jgi:hypothetical protein
VIHVNNLVHETLINPATAATNATAASLALDTAAYGGGANYAKITIAHSAATATNSSAKWAVLKLQAGNTTSSYSDVAGFIGTTNATADVGEFVLPVHNDTAKAATIEFCVDLRAVNKRYLRLVYTPPAGHNTVYGCAQLDRLNQTPSSAAEANVNARVIGPSAD